MEYCYSVLFNIHRIPGFDHISYKAEWIYASKENEITQCDIDKSCDFLRKMYEHTQNKLIENNLVKDGKVKGYRAMKPYNLQKSYCNTKLSNDVEVFYTNLLTSYATELIGTYSSDCVISRDIPVEDIVMWCGCIQYQDNTSVCPYLEIDLDSKENEIWVINREIRGKLEVPIQDVHYNSGVGHHQYIDYSQKSAISDNETYNTKINRLTDGALLRSQTIFPCMTDKRTLKRVKKNQEKLEKFNNLW